MIIFNAITRPRKWVTIPAQNYYLNEFPTPDEIILIQQLKTQEKRDRILNRISEEIRKSSNLPFRYVFDSLPEKEVLDEVLKKISKSWDVKMEGNEMILSLPSMK